MEVEILNNKPIESIEEVGDSKEIWGIKSNKTYRQFLQSKINHFMKTGNKDMEFVIRQMMMAYDHYHPQTTVKVEIQGFKGKSGINVQEYPTYFETVQYRKTDNEIKEIKHKIPKYQLKWVLDTILRLQLNKKVHTRYIAQEYVKIAGMDKDAEGRAYFDDKGYNFSMFFGCRSHYTPFNICLKILEYYKIIRYYKDGQVEKLKDSLELQYAFP